MLFIALRTLSTLLLWVRFFFVPGRGALKHTLPLSDGVTNHDTIPSYSSVSSFRFAK